MTPVPRLTKRTPKSRTPRTRLSAEAARDAILDATEKCLLEVGPQGLRLQDIARDLGISHPTVLHHFGSREELVDAVATRAMTKLHAELIAAFQDLDVGHDKHLAVRILERIDHVLRVRGHARLFAWLLLSKLKAPEKTLLRDTACALQQAWISRGKPCDLEEAQFAVAYTSAATFGLALLDRELFAMTGLANTDAMRVRFRAWMADLMAKQM